MDRVQVLYLEDEPGWDMVVTLHLEAEGVYADLRQACGRADYLRFLTEQGYDLILVDRLLADIEGLEAITLARQYQPGVPIIVLSGTLSEEHIVEALHYGATDYVSKQKLHRLGPVVTRALDEQHRQQQHQQVVDQLAQSETRLESIASNLPGAVYQFRRDSQGNDSLPYVSEGFERMFGITAAAVSDDAGPAFERVYAGDLPALVASIDQSHADMSRWDHIFRLAAEGQESVWLHGVSTPIVQQDGSVLWNGILLDVSQQMRMEQSLRKSESSLRAIIDGMLETFYRTDREGRLVMLSPSVESLLGYRREELLGTHLAALYAEPDGREHFLDALQQSDGSIHGYEAPLKHKQGHKVWVSTSARYILDDQGEVTGVEGITRDFTQKHDAELQVESDLALTHQRLDQVLGTLPTVLYAYELAGEDFITGWISDNITRVTGYPVADAMAMGWCIDHIHPDNREQQLACRRQLFAQGSSSNEYRFRHYQGHYIWILEHMELVRDDQGRPVGVNGSWNDVTERREMENALRRSEERLRRSQVFANIGTWDWDIQSGELFWSERIPPLFGYAEGKLETTYDHFLSSVHPDDRQRVIEAVNACVEHNAEYNIEHRCVWPDGQLRWLLEKGDVLRDAQGVPLRMLGVVQDITDRKLAEAALRESEALLKDAQKTGHIGNWSLDVASGALTWSDEICRIFGHQPGAIEPSYERFVATIHPDDRRRTVACQQEVYAVPGRVFSEDHRIILPSGEVRWVHEEARAVFDDDGKAKTLAGTVQDITERKQYEERLLAAKEEAEQANRAKSDFLSRMSHELRTPMNAIIGFSQLLEIDRTLTRQQRDNAAEIHKAGDHLLELINEVLDLAKIEAGRIAVERVAVDLHELFGECCSLIEGLARKHRIGMACNVDTRGQFAVIGDRVRLKQVLLNLMTNAIKYNRPDGSVEVICHLRGDGRIEIAVRDTGIGIDAEKLPLLFMPFNRLGVENSEIEGTGIGLVITKNLVELMGGELSVESERGVGSTFSLVLALAEPPDTATAGQGGEASAPAPPSLEGVIKTVVYIEDNPANLRLVEGLLHRLPGVRLLSAHEPMLGIHLVEETRPDLLLLDINLPQISGLDVLRRLRADPDLAPIPVIAVSANTMPADIRRAHDAGFDAYITKPIDVSAFYEIIESYL